MQPWEQNYNASEVESKPWEQGNVKIASPEPRKQSSLFDSIVDTTGQAVKDTASMIKGGSADAMSLFAAIPANINEAIGVDSSTFRDSQKYWQDISADANKELDTTYGEGDNNWKTAGKALGNPLNLLAPGVGAIAKGANIPAQVSKIVKPSSMARLAPTRTEIAIGSGVAGGVDTASNIAGTGDMSGVNIKDVSDVAAGTAIGTAAPVVLGKGMDMLLPNTGPTAGINKNVVNFAKRKGITDKQLVKMLDGVPVEQHAETIANYTQGGGTGLFKQVLKQSDDRITEFQRRAQTRVKDVEKVAGTENMQEMSNVAGRNFGEMVENVRNMNISVNSSNVLDGIDTSRILGGSDDTAKNMLNSMDTIFRENPSQNLSDLLLMREELNGALKNATGTSKYMLNKAKSNLDNIIENGTSGEVNNMIKTTVKDYANAKQNLKMGELIQSSKNKDGIINYRKLSQKLSESGDIDTYQSRAVVNILEQFDKKFNNDYRVLGGTKGDNTKEGLLGLKSEILSPLKSIFVRWGEYGNNVAMQKLIAKSLDKSKTPYEFASNIAGDQRVPQEIRDIFRRNLAKAQASNNGSQVIPDTQVNGVANQVDEVAPTSVNKADEVIETTQSTTVSEQVEIQNIANTVPPIVDDVIPDTPVQPTRTAQEATQADIDVVEARRVKALPTYARNIAESGGVDGSTGRITERNGEINIAVNTEQYSPFMLSRVVRNSVDEGTPITLTAPNGRSIRITNSIGPEAQKTKIANFMEKNDIPTVRMVNEADNAPTPNATAIEPTPAPRHSTGDIADVGSYNAENRTLNTSSNASRDTLRQSVSEMLEDNGGKAITLTNSNGRVTKRITSPDQIDSYWDASSASRRTQDTPTRTTSTRTTLRPSEMDEVSSNIKSMARTNGFHFRTSNKSYSRRRVSANNERILVKSKDGAIILDGVMRDASDMVSKMEAKVAKRAEIPESTKQSVKERLTSRGHDFKVTKSRSGNITIKNSNGTTIARKNVSNNGDVDDLIAKVDSSVRPNNSTYNSLASGVPRNKTIDTPKIVDNINKSLEASEINGFDISSNISGNGASITVKRDGSDIGSFYVKSDGTLSANTTGSLISSETGSKVYKAVWDAIEPMGYTYKASSGLSSENKKRMTANMISWMNEKGLKSTDTFMGNSVQEGFRNSGISSSSLDSAGNFKMDEKNSIKLAQGFKQYIDGMVTPTGRTQSPSKTLIGQKTRKAIDKYLAAGSTMAAFMAMLSTVKDEDDFYQSL